MKRILVLFAFALCVWQVVKGQVTFQKTYNVGMISSYPNSFQVTSDSGLIVVGTCDDMFSMNAFLLKLNSIGDTLWSRIFDSGNQDEGVYVVQTFDGGYAMCGTTSNGNTFLLKTDSQGNQLWAKEYVTAFQQGNCHFLIQKSDSNLVFCGRYNFISYAFTIETDPSGNVVSSKKYGDQNSDFSCIEQTTDGGFIASGSWSAVGFSVTKINSNGSSWSKIYTASVNTSIDGLNSVIRQTSDGNFIAACTFTTYDSLLDHDICLIKMDTSGVPIWSYVYTGIDQENNFDVEECKDGGFIASGFKYTLGQAGEAYAMKVDSLGTIAWFKTYGDSLRDDNFAIREAPSGGFVSIGSSFSFHQGFYPEVYCIKSDSNGNSGCHEFSYITSSYPLTVQYSLVSPLDSVLSVTTSNAGYTQSSGSTISDLCFYDYLNQEINSSINDLDLYPNPTSSQFTIDSRQYSMIAIEVYNVLGEKISAKQLHPNSNSKNRTTIDINGLSPGIYFLKVQTENGAITQKFIKE